MKMSVNEDEIISVIITEVDGKERNAEDCSMVRRSATFQEVAITLPNTSQLPRQEKECGSSVPDNINSSYSSTKKSFLTPRTWNLVNRVRSLPKIVSRRSSRRESTRSAFSVASHELESDSNDPEASPSRKTFSTHSLVKRMSLTPSQINLAAIGNPFAQMKKTISSSDKHKNNQNAGNDSPLGTRHTKEYSEKTKEERFQRRIDRWSLALQKAIHEDIHGNTTEAHNAYRRFNIKVTKDSIAAFEQFTHDQQKLLNRLMTTLDKRCKRLLQMMNREYDIDSQSSEKNDNISDDTTLADLRQCLGLLSTIKMIGSKKTIPVMLVYKERIHRKRHRDERKGQSNKLLFPKEKREFLERMGLPEKMITEQGIDFTVMPLSHDEKRQQQRSDYIDKDESNDSFVTAAQYFPSEQRTQLFVPQENVSNVANKNHINIPPLKKESKLSLVEHCRLGLKKRLSSSRVPSPVDQENNYQEPNTLTVEEWIDQEISKPAAATDSTSMLSCDSCSSSESVDSVYNEMETDTAVLANHRHREMIFPPPPKSDSETNVVLVFEKIGVKKTNLLFPYLRVSLRDNNGTLLDHEQETECWDVINSNYLRAPAPVYLQQSLETLPEDISIFFELRHLIPSKRKISTHSYTFLERSELQSGEFVCEMFKPPVDFSRNHYCPYSEKALFLHMDIRLEIEEPEEVEADETDEEEEEYFE